jgi:[pyruvate, water dikinase]-phosphate phosphotransferase / [pyruvate, water dikinase] kinase
MKRSAFFISDSTGITAEALGQSLLRHFDDIEFDKVTLPFIDTEDKAHDAVRRINAAATDDGAQPIIFDTVVQNNISDIIAASDGFMIDIFSTFLSPLEKALSSKSNYHVGRPQIATVDKSYSNRINAVNYALDNDDGGRVNRYDDAQIILIGVSRSGKTPCCLYLAMQSGIYAANYPLTEEDLDSRHLPKPLQAHQGKIYGLTIHPERLSAIRNERRSSSRYASITQCEDEVRKAEALLKRFNIPFIDTTHASIEEISTRILVDAGLRDHSR